MILSDKILLLYTHWKEDFWTAEAPRKGAPYQGSQKELFLELDKLTASYPLPALGIYASGMYKGEHRDYTHKNFVYLKVTGMDFDDETREIRFYVKPVCQSSTPSKKLLEFFGR